MTYKVKLTAKGRNDIKRLYTYLLDHDEEAADRALEAITSAIDMLHDFPFSCRKASAENSLIRELLVPFGSSGYIVLFRIDGPETVTIAAVRHQREDDYH
ncbi:type II toxin-antitoxin system RelE/ParE family toxin [Rhizobium sp. GR12]|uniref:type II toxin-antitoxin system RelE/ParE family toxin n=1 Tax=Rhizobium sp. GR12 TaxID=3053925 RepID=UPI002FBE4FCC